MLSNFFDTKFPFVYIQPTQSVASPIKL